MNLSVLEKNRSQGCCCKSTMERTASLSATEIWLWIICGPQTLWPSNARDPCRTGEYGEQEADSEELEGIPEKQIVETLQPLSQDSSEPLQEGVGIAISQQKPPAPQYLLFHGSSSTVYSVRKTPACLVHPPISRILGVLTGKRLTHFAL